LIEAAQYQIDQQPQTQKSSALRSGLRKTNAAEIYQATNPAQQLSARFNGRDVVLQPLTNKQTTTLQARLRLRSYGYGRRMLTAGAGTMRVDGNRITAFGHPMLSLGDVALPLVRIEPQYPPQARQRNLEGWVQVQFTISTTGSVKDAVVVKSSNSLFEHNALQAVSKWKYQPQIRGGKPAETAGQQVVLRFRMDT
jgi:TonB family protein